LNNLVRGSPIAAKCYSNVIQIQIDLTIAATCFSNLVIGFGEDFRSFLKEKNENWPRPVAAMFLIYQHDLGKKQLEGNLRTFAEKYFSYLPSNFVNEDFQSILYRYIRKIGPAPWRS